MGRRGDAFVNFFRRLFQNKWQGNAKTFLLLTFISIVCLSVAVSLLIYATIFRTLRSQMIHNGMQTVNNLYQENEASYFHVQSLLRNLMNDTDIQEFTYDPETDPLSERYWWIPIYEKLKYYQVLYPNLDDIYIYYPDTNVVISSSQPVMQDQTYLYGKLDDSEAAGEDWEKELQANHYPAVQIDIFPNEAVTFWGMIDQHYPAERAYIFLELDLQYMLDRYAREMTEDSGLHLFENERLVFSTNADFLPNTELIKAGDGLYEEDRTICIFSKSDSFGMRYVLTCSKDIFWQPLRNVWIYTVLLLIFYLIIAFITIWIYTRWNQQQIQAILKLAGTYGVNMEGRENEFKKIRSLLSSLFYNQLEMQNQMNRQTADARTGFLQNLLTGNFDPDDANLLELERIYSLKLSSPDFLVILYQAPDLGSVLFSESQSEIGNRQMLYFAVLNMAEDIFPTRFEINSLVVGTNAVTLLGFDEEPGTMDEIRNGCDVLLQKVRDLLQARIRISISRVHTGIANIQFAYSEAEQMIAWTTNQNAAVISAEEVFAKQLQHGAVRYSLITEQQLLNFIKAGDEKKALDLIRQIFEENWQLSVSPEYQLLCSDLLSTLLKSMMTLETLEPQPQIREAIHAALRDANEIHVKDQFCEIAGEICRKYQLYLQDQNPLYQKLEEYIQTHYDEYDLNVSKLGEIFGYSSAYVSRVFKNAVGTSILDYIAGIRVERAKDALRNTENSAQQIAGMVGYCDYHSFLRVFKKIEGVSPQKFRENMPQARS